MTTTVLLVDDHAAFRRRARALLEAEGYLVIGEAADGAGALTEAARLNPDLALVDVQLPDLDGFAVVSQLRRAGFHGRLILISTRERDDYGSRVGQSGADGFISKPDLAAATLSIIMDR